MIHRALAHGDQPHRGREQSHQVPEQQGMVQRVRLLRPVVRDRRREEHAVRKLRRLPARSVPVQSGAEQLRRRRPRLSAHHIHADRRRKRVQRACAPQPGQRSVFIEKICRGRTGGPGMGGEIG